MRFNKRLLVVWGILTLLTLSYLWIDHAADHGGGLRASTAVTVAAILVAVFKVRVIFREFMEVRHAPVLLCRLTDAWVLFVGVALLVSHFAGVALR